LDPEGLDLHWSTVEALASVAKMDLIIHYPEMGLTRNLGQLSHAKNDNAIDLFFGSRKWRDIYKQYSMREVPFIHRKLMDLYEENLVNLGYQVKHATEVGSEPVIRNIRQGRLYRLLHASKHELGNKYWGEATKKDAYGQRKLL
jgi:three-Cys-motif partner protein